MLREDIREAAWRGQFHIYPIASVDEGLTILTGTDAGEPNEAGEFPPDSINGLVVARLTTFTEKQREYSNSSRSGDEREEDDKSEQEDDRSIE